jgi:ABC-type uncharacterized transport system permease subunit
VGELLLKATPLILCGVGLAIGFRANVNNIGADGQLTIGAIAPVRWRCISMRCRRGGCCR